MRLLKSLLFIGLFQPFYIFCQTEGWVNSCLNITPKVVEAMIDACGNQEEFFREYVVFKTGTSPYDIHNLAFKVTNPFNNAFVGSVKIDDLSTDPNIFQRLNAAVSSVCDYGISFRDVLSAPYYGTVPQDATLLVFNNKNLDLDYLKDNILPTLCGSKVFVALGTLKAQSPGTAIFRNFPKNRSCGTTGCLRRIDFQYDGINAPFCEEMTYDIKHLSSPAVIRPGDEFGDGSYIRPSTDTTLEYGGGGPTGANTICMPPEKLLCTVPPVPSDGNGFWNVLAFDDATFTNFKGFYQAKSGHTPSVSAPVGSFEYNTSRDGWKPHEAPSEAHPTYGALTAYDGCNTKADTFSILAKRKGFPCGDYTLRLLKYDDHVRIRIDADGDGNWDFDKPYNSPACSNGCNTDIWTGSLGANSKMQIFGIEQNLDFQTHLLFIKKNTSPIPLNITASTTPTPCGAPPTGTISLSVTGGNVATHTWAWTGPTPIPNNVATATNLAAGAYSVIVKDANGCQDSARFLVAQTNTIAPIIAKKDTSFCAGGVASLRGSATGGTGALTYEWTTADGKFISNQAVTTYTPYQSIDLVLKVTDASGCFKMDTMKVTINQLPYITIRTTIGDTICNDNNFTMKVNGANSFTWNAFPNIGIAGWIFNKLTPNEDSVLVKTISLPNPTYTYTVEGTDNNGCKNTAQKRFTIIPLPVVTINPITNSTLCNNDNPITVSGTPATGGTYYAVVAANNAPCVGCMVGQTFYPTKAPPGVTYSIIHELKDDKGCANRPSQNVIVNPCVVNPCPPDVTNLSEKSCDPAKVGVVTQNLKKFNGCDSTVITTTTLSLPDAVLVNGTSCNPLDTGTFVKKLINQNGCDSIVTAKIELLAKSETRLNATTCDPSVVGEKTVTLKNQNGCDSLVITTYTLAPAIKNTINLSSCNPADTGTFVKNLTNYLGCDSTVVTVIKLLASDTIRLTKTTCNWQEAGDFKAVYKNKNGCDSTIFLTITLLKHDTTYLNTTSCNPLDTGTFKKKLTNLVGCDSLIITKVSLVNKSETRLTATTCDPLSVGEKTVILKNQNGCDSLVITTYTLSNSASTNINSTSCNPLDTGTFVKNLKSYLGCDSIVTTKIALLAKSEIRLAATTCDPSVVGEKTVVLKNLNGCDSLVITTYTLSNSASTNINSTSCNPLDTGTFVKNLKNYLGCDSIVTTKISLLNKSETRLTATTCDPSGIGEKTVILTNQNGCDSLVITTYTLSNNVTTNLNSTSCNPLDTGIFVKNLKSYLGCDSIVTTKINLVAKSEIRLTATTCDPSGIGEKTVTLKNQNGCDSLVITTYILSNNVTTNLNSTSCNPLDTGTFVKNLNSYLGCDSIVTTKITLKSRSETRLTATTCDPSGVGEKTVTLKNQNGCDSLIITTYLLSNNVTTNLNSTSCNPLDTGIFVKNLKSYLGCDSIVTTKITLKSRSETRLTATTCDPAGVSEKTVTLKNQNGCDSLVITTYTLSNNVSINFESETCNSLDTGTFVKNLKSYLGCDSIVTTKIRLSKLDTGRLNQTTCDPLKVGSEYIKVRKKSGCDSVVLVMTTLAKMDTTFINLTSCSLVNVGEKIQKYARTIGCDSIVATRTRYAPTSLNFSIKRSKSITCNRGDDGEIVLSSITGGTPQYKIAWSNGDTNSVLKRLAAGKYQATVTDKDGCQRADSLDLKEPNAIEIEVDGISPRCFGEQFGSIEVGMVKGGLPPYSFNMGDVNKPMSVSPYTLSSIRVGRYQVKIFDQNKCFNDTFIDIKEGRLLSISLGNDTKITLGDSTMLNVTSDFNLKNIKWISDNAIACDTCLTNLVRPIATTTYKVKVQDTEGCIAEDVVTVFIDKNKRVYVPNSFSPNGDKENDILMVYSDQSVEKIMTFQVFNRWGSRIYEKHNFQPNDETAGWDGFFNGQLVQPDVVVYFIEVMFKDGKTEIFKGDVTVMK
jgi:gliding motility-associated-like protein